jgi:hypothetical protein
MRSHLMMLLCALFTAPAGYSAGAPLDLMNAHIGVDSDAGPTAQFAARELQRCLCEWTGKPAPIVSLPAPDPAVALEIAAGPGGEAGPYWEQGYSIDAFPDRRLLTITGNSEIGLLYGVYAFLEELGFGFYFGGDVIPPPADRIRVPGDLSIHRDPAFGVRGVNPYHDFLNCPTTWNLDDYKWFFGQMAKQKLNFVGFHCYDWEPLAAYRWEGKLVGGEPYGTSMNYGWGMVRGMKTEEFGWGTGRYFDAAELGTRDTTDYGAADASSADGAVREKRILASQNTMREAIRYARALGIHVGIGFELHGDPTDPETAARLAARLRAVVANYPDADYIWLWQAEGLGGGGGAGAPDPSTPMGKAYVEMAPSFAYLQDPGRIGEAVRMTCYFQAAYDALKAIDPEKKMGICGWGGDKHMRFTDFLEGMDELLPMDIVFTALDNIAPEIEPNISQVYAKLSAERQKWPIPWFESDAGPTRRDQWHAQCNVAPFVPLLRDALAKKCQGIMGIHWRTREVEEVAAYMAQFAWDTKLTYDGFYERFALTCYGPDLGPEMAEIHKQLEALGPRWTGGGGQTECGGFSWAEGGVAPDPKKTAQLATLRFHVARIRDRAQDHKLPSAVERLDYLLASMDVVRDYDQAAALFMPGGKVDLLVQGAEKARADAEPDKARQLADEAWRLIKSSGIRKAMERYVDKLTNQGEFGVLAEMNVKAYAAFQNMLGRLSALLGTQCAPGEVQGLVEYGREQVDWPHLVMKTPPTFFEAAKPLTIEAIAANVDGPVVVHWRHLGDKEFRQERMTPSTGSLRKATIEPGLAPVEYYVECSSAYKSRGPAVPAFWARLRCPRQGCWSAAPLSMPAREPARAAGG